MHSASVYYLYSKSELFGVVKEIFSLSHSPTSPTRQRQASSVSNRTGGLNMGIARIAKSHYAGIPKASSGKEWKLSDSLREKITGCGTGRLYGE